MTGGFNSVKDIIEVILAAITAGGILFAGISYKLTRRNLYLNTIINCIKDFRNLEELSADAPLKTVKAYIELVNEELLYFEQGYLPKEIANEWLHQMIDFVPLTNDKDELLNEENCLKAFKERGERLKLLRYYPRLRKSFTLKNAYDFKLIYTDELQLLEARQVERSKIVREVLLNLGIKPQ
jgi:hypothetical protein